MCPDVWAAGDIAVFPYAYAPDKDKAVKDGTLRRIEHYVVAHDMVSIPG